MYNFKRLVKKYGDVKPMRTIETDGHYDYENGGVWVDGTPEDVEFEGAVTPLPENLLKDGHAYTTEDKNLFCYVDLAPNAEVKHKGTSYTVMEKTDHSDFDEGLRVYILKRGGHAV